MGCLNSNENFNHWFGNIHLSGPCNRACYYCIGQHMMALDTFNNLNDWPLKNLDHFIETCLEKNITEINVTGSNTDPLLYKHTDQLSNVLRAHIPNLRFGLRTNGILALNHRQIWSLYDKVSISITSFDPELYIRTMGMGEPPNLKKIIEMDPTKDIKINVVLCPETVSSGDLFKTLHILSDLGIKRVNLREPYGQPHIGDPLAGLIPEPTTKPFAMPMYTWHSMSITYWDVHYVEVESVNLYANGVISTTYPVSKGHCPDTGKVLGQEHFLTPGRIIKQWNY